MALPYHEAETLRKLYDSGDRVCLQLYIVALRAQLWSLQEIADVLNVSRSTVLFWERNAPDRAAIMPTVPLSHRAIENAGVRTLKKRVHIPKNDRALLPHLAQQARKVTRTTPSSSQLKKDAELFDRLIEIYLERTVPITEIAQAAGISHRAISARLERKNA